MAETFWTWRRQDLIRHLSDLEFDSYEGKRERADRNTVFLNAFKVTTPIAVAVLEDFNLNILGGSGEIHTVTPTVRPELGYYGRWEITWPEQRAALSRFDGSAIPPLQLQAFFPDHFTHGHLMIGRPYDANNPVSTWFFQVTDHDDALRQRPILEVMCETQVHEMIFTSNWRIIPLRHNKTPDHR